MGQPAGTQRSAAKRKKKAKDQPSSREDDNPGQGNDDIAPLASKPRGKRRYGKVQDEFILPPGTKYQGGLRGVQFFVGDLVEVKRDGELQYARVARIPTDERPMDGSFIIKWDSDGEEWKCAYRDIYKPRNPESVPFPSWIADWWPAEPPPTLAEEMEQDWTWVSDLRPGQPDAGGMFPEFVEDDLYWQYGYGGKVKDPYKPWKDNDPRAKW